MALSGRTAAIVTDGPEKPARHQVRSHRPGGFDYQVPRMSERVVSWTEDGKRRRFVYRR